MAELKKQLSAQPKNGFKDEIFSAIAQQLLSLKAHISYRSIKTKTMPCEAAATARDVTDTL